MPTYEGLGAFQQSGGQVIHSSKYTDAKVASGKKVVVIGSAKSAIDIALDTAKVASSPNPNPNPNPITNPHPNPNPNPNPNPKVASSPPTILMRNAHWGTPRFLLWFIPFQYIFLSRLGQLLVSLFKGAFPGAPSWVGMMHSCLACMMRYVFRLVEELIAFHLGHYGDYRPSMDVVKDFYGYGHVLSSEFKESKAAGNVSLMRGEVVRLVKGGAIVKSPPKTACCWGDSPSDLEAYDYEALGEEQMVPCDLVICDTGFTKTYDYLPATDREALGVQTDGLYLYKHIFPAAVADLAFCGSEIATITNVMTHALHAEYITRVLTGSIVLPGQVEMQKSINEMTQVEPPLTARTGCDQHTHA